MGGGWQAVATLLLAATFCLPRFPRHFLWPWYSDWGKAMLLAADFLAPVWPHSWQRWLAERLFGMGLVHYTLSRSIQLWHIRKNRQYNMTHFG
jgi:hypothetical protein